jgi:signal transduction histidine kinase
LKWKVIWLELSGKFSLAIEANSFQCNGERTFRKEERKVIRDANAIELSLQQCGQDVQLIIEDNGCGFAPEIPQTQHGLGLRSMRERVAELHGTFRLQTLPGQGTCIQIALPLEVRS